MKFAYIFVFLFSSIYCFGQTAPKQKAQNYYFYKKDGHNEVSTMDSAEIIQVISEPDSGSKLYGVQEFYKTKSLRFSGQSLEVHPVKLQGQSISYYPNGKKKLIATYEYNRPRGDTYCYYPNGKLYLVMNYSIADSLDDKQHKIMFTDSTFKYAYDSTGRVLLDDGNGYFKKYNDDFTIITEEGLIKNGKRDGEWKGLDAAYKMAFTETYNTGKLLQGNSVDSAGIKYSYTQRRKPAQYKNGLNGFGRFLAMSIRYPLASRQAGHQGRVTTGFIVNNDGTLSNFKITGSVDRDIDAEALRILKYSQPWTPGEYLGKKISTYYTVPISFTLQ